MMNPVPWLQMTNMISYQGLVRTFLGTVLNSAGTQTIYASATSDKANIKGGKQTVYGLATEANIESGEQIVDGGSTEKTHINGGTQTVQNYGKAINTDIVSGLQQIMANGTGR